MKYPLVRELAVDGIPVTVTCRVLKFSAQGYYAFSDGCCTPVPIEVVHRFRRSCTPRKVVTLALA